MTASPLAAYERQFRRAGLPLFIDGYSLRTDVFNRAGPLLAFVFGVEILGALDLDFSWWANALTLVGVVLVIGVAYVAMNVVRRRPLLQPLDSVGPLELGAFLIVPSLLPFILADDQWRSAGLTFGFNLALLVLIVAVLGMGVHWILWWAIRRVGSQLADSFRVVAKVVPLFILFAFVLFFNNEMWQVFAETSVPSSIAVLSLLTLIGWGFMALRTPREVGELTANDTAYPLSRGEKINVGFNMWVNHAVQMLIVSVAMGAFFVVLGSITITAKVQQAWTDHATAHPNLVAHFTVLDVPVRFTTELLDVSSIVGALCGISYAINVLTDQAYREEFLDGFRESYQRVFAARDQYRHELHR